LARSVKALFELERLAGCKLTEIAWLLSLAHEPALEHDDNLKCSTELLIAGSGGERRTVGHPPVSERLRDADLDR